jgi:hypothetical protein
MSSNILSSNTLANPNRPLYGGAVAGGVTQLVAGSGVTLSPAGGTGIVTINTVESGSVVGTANQITATTAGGTTTLALASPSPAPVAGAYTNSNITIDALGRITSATNGNASLTTLSFYRASVVLPDNPAGLGNTINLFSGTGLYTGLDLAGYYLMTVSASIQNTTPAVFPAGLTNGAWLLNYGAFTAPGQTQLGQSIYSSGLINVADLQSPIAQATGQGNIPINYSAIVQPASLALTVAPTLSLLATGGTNTNAGSATLYGINISFVRIF